MDQNFHFYIMYLYNATVDRWSCHLLNRNVCAMQVFPMGVGRSVPLRSDIKGTELPPANILIPLERQLTAIQLCRWQFLYNETLQQTIRPLLSKLFKRRQIYVFDPHFEEVRGGVEPWLMARWKARVEFLLSVTELLFLSLTVEALQGKTLTHCFQEGMGQFESRFLGEGVVPGEYFLVSTKLDTFCYLTAQTAPCYVQSSWHNTGMWQTDRQTELL